MLTNEFPLVSSNLKVGMGIFGTADPYNPALQANGALNPLGCLAFFPAASAGGYYFPGATSIAMTATSAGYGSGILAKYVLFRSTTNTAMVAGAAPVFYTDTTQTIVTGTFAESGMGGSNSSAAAGWMPLNTGSTSWGLGSAVSAAIINNTSATGNLTSGVGGSFVWIIISGYIPSAYLAAGAVGNMVYASGNWATTGVAPGSAVQNIMIGKVANTVTATIGDVIAYPGGGIY